MAYTNINALNGISNSYDPFGIMRFYDNPKKKKGKDNGKNDKPKPSKKSTKSS